MSRIYMQVIVDCHKCPYYSNVAIDKETGEACMSWHRCNNGEVKRLPPSDMHNLCPPPNWCPLPIKQPANQPDDGTSTGAG